MYGFADAAGQRGRNLAGELVTLEDTDRLAQRRFAKACDQAIVKRARVCEQLRKVNAHSGCCERFDEQRSAGAGSSGEHDARA